VIPKVLHSVWSGSGAMTPDYESCMRSWDQTNPTWEHRHWTDADLAKLPLTNPWIFDLNHPTLQSMLVRVEVVRLFGGVYLDCDIELLKPIDPVFEGKTVALSMRDQFWPDDCVIAAEPGSSWLTDLCAAYGSYRESLHFIFDQERPFCRTLARHPEVCRIPREVLSVSTSPADSERRKSAYGIHHYVSRWKATDARYAAEKRG